MFGWLEGLFEKALPALHRDRAEARKKRFADRSEPVVLNSSIQSKEVVAFVHGLGGHFEGTWKNFPALLDADPDLPKLKIFLSGYDASPVPGVNSINNEGKRFVSNLRSQFVRDEEFFLVGHSMGGLVILDGLIQELIELRAETPPVRNVKHVTLYASPIFGAEVAAILKGIGHLPAIGAAVSRQIVALAPGDYVNNLLFEVNKRIYKPHINAGEFTAKRAIKITACVGLRDQFVAETSARGIFDVPPPEYLDHDHFAVKEPVSRNDSRYRPLKNVLELHFVDWLTTWRVEMKDPIRGAVIASTLRERLRHCLEQRLADRRDLNWLKMGPTEREEWFREYFAVVVDDAGALPGQRLSDVLNFCLLSFLGDDISLGH